MLFKLFLGLDKYPVLKNIKAKYGKIRGEVGKSLKNAHKIPELTFFIDDSEDYAEKIDQLLKK
ncbi:MAG: ribosome-binding factor A [Crocinitomicaceae bacterium]